jgi:phosphoribosylformylglycinamidine synthase
MIKEGKIVSAYALGNGGLIEALAKMSFGNNIGFQIKYDENLLDAYNYGSIVVESKGFMNYKNAILIGRTKLRSLAVINGVKFPLEDLYEANRGKFTEVYKDMVDSNSSLINIKAKKKKIVPLKNKDEVVAYFPVFPGTNCDYDTEKRFRNAGATIKTSVFRNLTSQDIFDSIDEMAANIDNADIFVLSGGFSAGDEPDGSGKFIANVLNQDKIKDAINRLIERKGLILGICNGFQALIKSGLLPYGKLGEVKEDSPTLFRNDINRHVSQIVSTKVMTNGSPWLSSFSTGEVHSIAVSHGEGKFVVSLEEAKRLRDNGQIAFVYVDDDKELTTEAPYNPNGSNYAIEGIISPDGLILGKMGHSERYEEGLFKNISGDKSQNLFQNAVDYFKK